MSYITKPEKIEEKSFEIIHEMIKKEYPAYQFSSEWEERIIKRVIHTSADFDYLENLTFTNGVSGKLTDFFQRGKGTLFTDTTMALSGINKAILEHLGICCRCYVADRQVAELAKEKGITRSMAGVDFASAVEGPKIFVIGNAPTAIFKILELIESRKLEADAVVGVPVGFVGALESKEALFESQVPAITARGRKGGSNVAAAIVNAVLYQLPEVRR